jgi:hypothetical protein
MIPSYLVVQVKLLFLMFRHASSAAWVVFSFSMSSSAESERPRPSHMRTQFAWACLAQGAMFGFHLMMPYTFLLLSSHAYLCTGATPLLARTIHKQSTSSRMPMHPVLLFCMRTAWKEKGFAPRRKAPSCNGAKRAAGLQACMSASYLRSCLMCGMQASCMWHQYTPCFCFWCDGVCDSLSVSSFFFLSHSHSLSHSLSLTFSLPHSLLLCKYIYILLFSLSPSLPFSFVFFSSRRSRLLIPSYLLNAHVLFQSSFILAHLIPFYPCSLCFAQK